MTLRKQAAYFAGIIALFTICAFPKTVRAQHRIRGRVEDENQHPVPNADVYIPELQRGTATDEDGNFNFGNLPGRELTLVISHLRYRETVLTVDPGKSSNSNRQITIILQSRTVQNEPILVTGTRIQSARQASLPVTVINQQDLRHDPEPTLWDAVSQTPGIALETNGPGVMRPVIRGLSTRRIQVVNRNMEYDYQKWDPESGLSMNGNNTEQIEILRGPASLQYGSGAMGGVISLAQGRPAPEGETRGSYRLGLFSNTQGINNRFTLNSGHENYYWGLSGSYDSHADYQTGEGETIRNARYNNLELQANTGLRRSWGNTRLTYEYLRHKNDIVETEETEPSIEEEESGRKIERPYHMLANHSLISETNWFRGRTHLNLTLGLQSNRQQEFEPLLATGTEEEEAAMDLLLNTFNYRGSILQKMTRNFELNAGIQGNIKENESKGEETFVPSADFATIGLFTIGTWSASENITVEGGLRYDYHQFETSPPEEGSAGDRIFSVPQVVDRQFDHGSGSLGISYRPAAAWTIKANIGLGYRTPDIAELTADGLLREIKRYEVGDNNLDPETNTETDLGITYRGSNFDFYLNGFYNAFDNYIYQQQNGTVTLGNFPNYEVYPVFYFRQDQATLYGGEAGLTLHPESASWIELESNFSLVIGENKELNEPLPMMPAPSVANTLTLRKSSFGTIGAPYISLDLTRYFKQTRTASFEEQSNGYWLTDLSIGGNISLGNQELQLSLAANNLFDVEYISHLSLLKNQGITNMGRNISLMARIPFSF